MIVAESQETREQLSRWIGEGQAQHLGVIFKVLQDYDRFHETAEAAERENEQLRGLVYENEKLRNRVDSSEHECEQLREEVSQLRVGNERHRREREEVADALTRVMNEALSRLRCQEV